MERVVTRFRSREEAEEAEHQYYARLSPKERVDLLLELVAQASEATDEAESRLARVCRIAPLGGG